MSAPIPLDAVREVFAGREAWIVGGAVRDAIRLLSESANPSEDEILEAFKDIDITTTAPPSVGYPLYSETWETADGRVVAERDLLGVVPPAGGTALVLSTEYFRE